MPCPAHTPAVTGGGVADVPVSEASDVDGLVSVVIVFRQDGSPQSIPKALDMKDLTPH